MFYHSPSVEEVPISICPANMLLSFLDIEIAVKTPRTFEIPLTFCEVCLSDDSRELLTCASCSASIHSYCYYIEPTSAKQWICQGCLAYHLAIPAHCLICGKFRGILKMLSNYQWVHVLCIELNPMLGWVNNYKEISFNFAVVLKHTCYICSASDYYCISCQKRSCALAFHPMCAQVNGLHKVKGKIFCEQHHNIFKDEISQALLEVYSRTYVNPLKRITLQHGKQKTLIVKTEKDPSLTTENIEPPLLLPPPPALKHTSFKLNRRPHNVRK